MKKTCTFLVLISLAMWVQAQKNPDYNRIAENIVKNSLEVQPGELVQKSLEMGTGDKDVLSVIDIGINPESHPLENSDYYSWEMAGMITITTGINQWPGEMWCRIWG
jgi:hypothetical protein